MANNYLQFSEVLDVQTDEQRAWIDGFLRQPDDMFPEEGTPEAKAFLAWCTEHGLDEPESAQYYPSFNWSWEGTVSSGEKKKYEADPDNYKPVRRAPWSLWLRCEESCNLDEVAALVRAFHKHFKIDDVWTLTYAETCSRLRVGEFSGGGFIVYPRGRKVEWTHPEQLFSRVRRTRARKGG